MKEINEVEQKEEEPLIEEVKKAEEKNVEKEEEGPLLLKKYSTDSDLTDEEQEKELHNSRLYNLKDYIFFFVVMISSSMNFSYLYFPLIIIGINFKFLIGKNDDNKKFFKSFLELTSLGYSVLLLAFKITCIVLINNESNYIFNNAQMFLDLGICYLRDKDSSFYLIMTFLGEAIVILFSLLCFILGHIYKKFDKENDIYLIKNTFWTSRNLIFLNYIFIASFAVFNTSFLTLLYMCLMIILFFQSSLNTQALTMNKLSKIIFILLIILILIQVAFINIFNVPRLQENILYGDAILDSDGNIKVYSTWTKIGINYSFNIKIKYVWKEWIGYLAAICSLVTLTYSVDNLSIGANNLNKKNTLEIKKNNSNEDSCIKKVLNVIINFITSPILIINICRIISIFYIYLYTSFYSIGIFIAFFLSSIYIDVKKNRLLTAYLLTPMLILSLLSYHISNINGLFENFSDERRKRLLNFALGKYEYSFLEYYGHNLFFVFIMFLIYSFYSSLKTTKIMTYNNSINDANEPLLEIVPENENNNIIEIVDLDEHEKEKKQSDLNFGNLILKFIFTYIDLITLIAMYFVSMRSINIIHLVLVVIFLIQILLPQQIKKIYKIIICILQVLFFIELLIHLLKAYCMDQFNESKNFMSFLSIYTDKISDNNMELMIFIVIYCFYFQYQFHNFPYLMRIMSNKKITLEKYVEVKFKKLPKTKMVLTTLGIIISNLYIWILIGVFFVISCYFEINLIFAIKLGYFLFLSFNILFKIQNPKEGNRFSAPVHYIFLIFCCLNSFCVYVYQFRADAFFSSLFEGSSIDNFFVKNLPNIGFSIYQKDNLYLNFLPHFGITFISVLFIAEIKRQLSLFTKKKFVKSKTIEILDEKKGEIEKKLMDNKLSMEDIEILKAKKYEENEKVLKYYAFKYFVVNTLKIIAEFYFLLLFLSIGIIFSFYDLSFSMTIYIIIFGIIFFFMFYRRIKKLNAYVNKPSYFVSKVIRYTLVEKVKSQELILYYRNLSFKILLSYSFIFILLLYLYGVFDLFQHGCNDEFFKGCEKSYDPIFQEDGTVEEYIKAFAYLFGIYVDVRKEGLIKVAWVHILLSILIGLDIYSQKLVNKFTFDANIIRENMLKLKNENNILYRYDKMRDQNILIKIGLKLAGISDSNEVRKKMREEYDKFNAKFKKPDEKKGDKKEFKKEQKDEKKADENNKMGKENEIKIQKEIDIEENEEDKKIMDEDANENLEKNQFLKCKIIKKLIDIFSKSNDNDQTLSDSNNNGTKVIWFVKKIFEEIIIALLLCIGLTKLNILSFIYFIYFAFLTITEKSMIKFYILYCVLLFLIIVQSVIYITNISEDTCPRPNSDLFNILNKRLSIPWYNIRYSIEKKNAFFYGFGVNKTQMSLLLLEYIQIIVIYIYLEYFSFSIYQDVMNKGEKKAANSKFDFGAVKLHFFLRREVKQMDKELFNQYKECLMNFNLDIGNNLDEMLKKFSIEKEEQKFPTLPMKAADNNAMEKAICFRDRFFNWRDKMKKEGNEKIPDSSFVKSFQEFTYLYLHILFLLAIILICIMITGIISIFYLLICFYYLINSHKIYLGMKYGYPKQIKKLLKICLIVDIIIQLVYQIPFISPGKDTVAYKIFNSLGYTKLLIYDNNGDNIDLDSSGVIEYIGKPLIYFFISLQTIIYNSKDFKKYYLIFLLGIRSEMKRNGFVNSFIFNNSRIQEFKDSVDLRIENEKKMDEIKDILVDFSKKCNLGDIHLFEEPKADPLKIFRQKEREKKIEEEKKKKEGKIIIEKVKEKKIPDKIEEKKEDKDKAEEKKEIIKKDEIKEEDKKKEDEQKPEEIKSAKPGGLFGNLRVKMKEKKEKEQSESKLTEEKIIQDAKEKGLTSLFIPIREKNKKIVSPEVIMEKIKNILLGGKLIKLYLWINKKSIYFKSMEIENRNNFEKECFAGNTITHSYIENEIENNLKILDLSDFTKKEVDIIEDFFTKFRNGKLQKELDKIKKEIRQKKIEVYKGLNQNNNIINNQQEDINTNSNQDEIINNNNNNNNNDLNDTNIDEKELEKIDVKYTIKKGETEININSKKFRQFYDLLELKLFRIYLRRTYLIESIILKLKSFISNNFDYFTYLIMILDHIYNCSILSMFYPLSVFCYALLENPRPKKTYWQICHYYTIFILVAKFIFQLKLFNSIMDSNDYRDFVSYLYNYKIGIRYIDEGFNSEFFKYIALDSVLLLMLSLNKNILIANGLWYQREEEIENIYLASERLEINKDRPIDKIFYTLIGYKNNEIFEEFQKAKLKDKNKEKNKKKEKKKKKKIELIKDEETTNLIEEKKEKEEIKDDKGKFNKGGKPANNDMISKEDVFLFYDKMKHIPKYDEGNKKYYEKLFPRIRNEKPGSDQYPELAISLAAIIVYILLFFTQMAQDKTFGPVDLDTTQFSGTMVLFLILHVVVLVYDRILYISQNKNNLKYKYFIYKKDKFNKGVFLSKQEYNTIKSDYGYEVGKPFHFSPRLIKSLKEKGYNLFYIQTENFNCPSLQKYILHLFCTVICHAFAFIYFPITGNYNLQNSVYCLKTDPSLCNEFHNNAFVIVFYLLYLIYLYISSVQLRLGYYDIKRKSLFKRNTTVTNLMAKIFNAIPFLPQLKYTIDWTFTSTCLDLFSWIKFESIYDSIFDAYTDEDKESDEPVGQKVGRKSKMGMGAPIAFILILLLIVPLILYSSLNPTNKSNNLTAGKLNVDLTFIDKNGIKLNYNLFENTRAKSISEMFQNGDADWKRYKYSDSVQTKNFHHDQIQIIKFSETSDRNWDLAEPHIKDLIDLLNITKNKDLDSIQLKISVAFERDLPAEAQEISHDFEIEIYNSSTDINATKIGELRDALANCTDVKINFADGYSSPLRITASKEITEIKDEDYIKNKDIELGFQGCQLEQRTDQNNITKIYPSYLRSYFTFRSKDPEEEQFSAAEFHAFNDMISETISGYSVFTFYLTFILLAGSYVADFLSNEPEKIMFTDLPHPEKIVQLCEGIQISRYSYNFKEEESLYTMLIELMRSPDYLKMLTESSLKELEKRKQNSNDPDKEEDEVDEKDKKKEQEQDNDDEDDNFYADEKEIEERQEKEKERLDKERQRRGGFGPKPDNFNNKGNKKEGDNNNIQNIKEPKEKKEGENNDILNIKEIQGKADNK